jgi:hypothetical protein
MKRERSERFIAGRASARVRMLAGAALRRRKHTSP